ncbi:MAG TPA: hypothetical protein DEP87_00795 [Candidatus Pacebacteria bacterium]|nr:hypothetical protein [Candidatus Paceibacterota bacterium]
MYITNISLPPKLRDSAQVLINQGYYASFSDLVRDSLRQLLERQNLTQEIYQVKQDLTTGAAKTIASTQELKQCLDVLENV